MPPCRSHSLMIMSNNVVEARKWQMRIHPPPHIVLTGCCKFWSGRLELLHGNTDKRESVCKMLERAGHQIWSKILFIYSHHVLHYPRALLERWQGSSNSFPGETALQLNNLALEMCKCNQGRNLVSCLFNVFVRDCLCSWHFIIIVI